MEPERKKTKLSTFISLSQTSKSTKRPAIRDTRCKINKAQTLLSIAYLVTPPPPNEGGSSYFSKRVACLLNTLCKVNSVCTNDNYVTPSIFFKTVEGPGEVQQLVDKVEEREKDSAVILTTALILLDRVQQADTPVQRESVMRLFATCVLVAVKMHKEDRVRNYGFTWLFVNSHKVAKRTIKPKRLMRIIRKLEVLLLEKLEWRTFITAATYRRYQDAITDFFL